MKPFPSIGKRVGRNSTSDPRRPPVSISVAAKVVPSWIAKGSVTEPPPPSPLAAADVDAGDERGGTATTLVLQPFGSTQIRIAAFPWTWAPPPQREPVSGV